MIINDFEFIEIIAFKKKSEEYYYFKELRSTLKELLSIFLLI